MVNFAPQPLYTWERILVPLVHEAGLALEPLLTFLSGEKYLGSTEIRNPDLSVNSTVVCFLLGNSPASEFYMPTFRNTLSVPFS